MFMQKTKIPPEMVWNVAQLQKDGLYFSYKAIQEFKPNGRVVVKDVGEMIMLGGYSYLGLKGHPKINEAAKSAIDQFGTGTDGSRLLAGTLSLHEELENAIADFKHTEAAITFSSGYVANVSTISSLVKKNDFVISDKMNHASIIDGCRFSQAHFIRYPYNQLNHLENVLKQAPLSVRKLIVVDAIFSMEGAICDLPKISELCKKYNAYLMVDEAHSVGVLGATGSGIEEFYNLPYNTIDIKMGTLSKTIPSSGGYVAGTNELCTYLKHEARGLIYSGAPSPASVAAAIASFDILKNEPERIHDLQVKTRHFRKLLVDAGFEIGHSQTPVVPIIIGETIEASMVAKYCQENGVFIHAILPPVVPPHTARLRASVMATHTFEDLAYCVKTMKDGMRKLEMESVMYTT